jgi:hypothetical protein
MIEAKSCHAGHIQFSSKNALDQALKHIKEFIQKYEIYVPVHTSELLLGGHSTTMRHLHGLYEECGTMIATVMYIYPVRQNFYDEEFDNDIDFMEEEMHTEIHTKNKQQICFTNQMEISIPILGKSDWILFTDIVQAIYPFTSFSMIDFLMASRDRDTAVSRVFRHTLCERQLFRLIKKF